MPVSGTGGFTLSRSTLFVLFLLVAPTAFAVGPAAPPPSKAAWVEPALLERAAAAPDETLLVTVGLTRIADEAMLASLLRDGFPASGFRHVPAALVHARGADVARLVARPEIVSAVSDAPLDVHQDVALVPTTIRNNHGGTGDEITRSDRARALGVDGAGVGLAVIDLGVSGLHPGLRPRALGGPLVQNVKVLVGPDTQHRSQPSLPVHAYLEDQVNTDMTDGHGTHTAAIAAGGWTEDGVIGGRAPGVDLVALGAGDVIAVPWIVASFDWVIEHHEEYGIRVVSNSYGSQGPYVPQHPASLATKAADDAGILVVFSAGNYGPQLRTLNSFAQAPYVLAVGSTSLSGAIASSSSRGDPRSGKLGPDIMAPGVEIIGGRNQWLSANEVTVRTPWTDLAYVPPEHLHWYRAISGTSMSAPQVAGIAALVLEADPTLTTAELRDILLRTARPLVGYDETAQGAGMIDAEAAVRAALGLPVAAPEFADATVVERDGNTLAYPFHAALVGSPVKGIPIFEPSHGFPVRVPAERVQVAFTWRAVGLPHGLGISLVAPDGEVVARADLDGVGGAHVITLDAATLAAHKDALWSAAYWTVFVHLDGGLIEYDVLAEVTYATAALPDVTRAASPPLPPPPPQRVPHEPIHIATDLDFTAGNGVTRGSGTEEDPYVIEGWDISPVGVAGITIGRQGVGTTKHVVIQNVRVHDTSRTCLDLSQVRGLVIRDSQFDGCDFAINLRGGDDVVIERNLIQAASRGPSLYGVTNAILRDNVIEGMASSGIIVSQGATQGGAVSAPVLIERNTLRGAKTGISILTPASTLVTMLDNTLGDGAFVEFNNVASANVLAGSTWLDGAPNIIDALLNVRHPTLPVNTIVDAGSDRVGPHVCFADARVEAGPHHTLEGIAWDFGDGQLVAADARPCHAYPDAQPRVARVVATFSTPDGERLVLEDAVRVG